MEVDLEKALKPARKLRKQLKDFSADASPEQVHLLRTQSRRIEASVHALLPQDDKLARRLLKAIKPIRRAAGHVRDMDVFIGNTLRLRHTNKAGVAEEDVVQLVEQLSNLRRRNIATLADTVARKQSSLRKLLKKYRKALKASAGAQRNGHPAATQVLASELDHWPRLQADNLHDFRIRSKELRYMLQLSPQPNRRSLEKLGKVKDSAGQWHDWLELQDLAVKLLGDSDHAPLLRAVRAVTREKLRDALAAANAVRKEGLSRITSLP